ncbi:zinc finger protein 91 [Gadus morhua]|uniref:zinc finger protein 91 n=1 Tax=Gadus morhua TaxID=8049 RepID=UPI0011B5BEE2|nr:zinc finger protein 91-like [Gadus morhua]
MDRGNKSDKQPQNKGDASASALDVLDGDRDFCCQDCGEDFQEEGAYLDHLHQHSQENCPVAKGGGQKNSSLVQSNDLDSHVLKRHGLSPQIDMVKQKTSLMTKQHVYECSDCGKSYGVIGHFLNHQRSHKQAPKSVFHELEQLKKKSFQCETCGRSYSRASALDAHRRCHEGNLVRSRNQAIVDVFQNEEQVVENEHTETHAIEPLENLFKCSCGKAFPALSRLKTHQRFSRNTQCSPEQLKEVKDVKDKPKKLFHCSECKKDFNRHIALVQHQRWHANSAEAAKKFPCEECGKVFMTLTFYFKHQRLVHSGETPAKSFLHQVCQLQKKGFECKDCGLKFSRASALQSHQLQHTDVYKDTEKETQKPSTSLPQHTIMESKPEETNQLAAMDVDLTGELDKGIDSTQHLDEQVDLQDSFQNSLTEVSYVIESDEDAEGYETGDFNVEVISDSESEEDPSRDLNPDLELLCESDQEIKEELEAEVEVSPTSLVLKPGMDLKIVQIDFEHMEQPSTPEIFDMDKSASEKFECPECPRWFSSASSLRVHKMWHGVHRKRRWTVGQHETISKVKRNEHLQKHKDEKPFKSVPDQADGLEKKSLFCKDCGKWFKRMSSFISHQQNHPKRKPYPCLDCNLSYAHASGLYNHRKNCQAQNKEMDHASLNEKVFNPKKTLLGPKIYHCGQCGKGFWSSGAYSHHKQSPELCLDLRPGKSTSSWKSVLGRPRSIRKVACPVCGRKFRHNGIMKSHMRKHEDGNHKCDLCSRSFRLFSSLLRHQVVHTAHLIPPPIKSFQHQVEQVKKNTYSCPDCGKLFSRAKALQFHMRSHGYDTGYSPSSPKSTVTIEALQCPTCLAHFNNKSSLRAHQKLCIKRDPQEVDVISTSENMLKCTSCPATFKSAVTFQDHIRECRKITTIGDAEVKRKGVKEEVTNSSKKEVILDEKKLGIRVASSKVNHSGPSDLKYKCKECERSFSVVGALNFHKRIHLQGHKSNAKTSLPLLPLSITPKKQEEQIKRPFYCSECGRRFSSNSALGTHKRWHTDKKFAGSLQKDDEPDIVSNRKIDEGPYHCTKCGKSFFYLCVLRRHQLYYPPCQTKSEPLIDSNINLDGNSKKSEPTFSCPQCNMSFVRGSLLAAHYEHQHSKKDPHSKTPCDPEQEKSKKKSVAKVGKPLDAPSSVLKSKLHQCPHCSMNFTKARGLRAHKWQAHSQSKKSSVGIKLGNESISSSCKPLKKGDISLLKVSHPVASKPTVSQKKATAGRRRKKGRSGLPAFKSIPCLDCGKRYSSAGALYNHKKVCLEFKKELKVPKQEILFPEPVAELPPALGRPSEYTVKCLFKCDKCGKAFQTEEQLVAHKMKAKSRPYCCALCCHSYWTETQLQQHLAWHDEIRRRLPIELRYRLSTAMTSRPSKPIFQSAGKKDHSQSLIQNSASWSQTSHKCQHCGKSFLSPSALQRHEAQHGGNGLFHCSFCPRTFGDIQDLIDHHQECMVDGKMQRDDPAAVLSGDTNGLTCFECGTSFAEEVELHQHYIEHAHGAH